MTLRAIIVDDEFTGINALRILIERHCPEIKPVANTRNPEDAIDLIESYRPDIVFLDINMPQMNGFEMLRKLKWRNFDLVFTTAYHEFAVKAIKVDAFDYLLKPIDPTELKEAITRILNKKNSNDKSLDLDHFLASIQKYKQVPSQKLIVTSKDSILSIDTDAIVCLELKSNYTQISYSTDDTILSSKTLKEYEKILCAEVSDFMRVHNSFVINLRKVIRYIKTNDTVVLSNNMSVPISKSRKDAFLKWLEL
jgi:two-component system LytT family response regulator